MAHEAGRAVWKQSTAAVARAVQSAQSVAVGPLERCAHSLPWFKAVSGRRLTRRSTYDIAVCSPSAAAVRRLLRLTHGNDAHAQHHHKLHNATRQRGRSELQGAGREDGAVHGRRRESSRRDSGACSRKQPTRNHLRIGPAPRTSHSNCDRSKPPRVGALPQRPQPNVSVSVAIVAAGLTLTPGFEQLPMS